MGTIPIFEEVPRSGFHAHPSACDRPSRELLPGIPTSGEEFAAEGGQEPDPDLIGAAISGAIAFPFQQDEAAPFLSVSRKQANEGRRCALIDLSEPEWRQEPRRCLGIFK